ncbi:MAG: hypothetical protein QXY95_02415 [Thermosphaera sp.]
MFLIPRPRKTESKILREKSGEEARRGDAKPVVAKKKTSKTFSIDDLISKYSKDVLEFLGLSELNIPEELKTQISREIIEAVTMGYSTKPDGETIIKRIKRNLEGFYELIAHRIIEASDDLDEKTLEYVVYRGGRAIIPNISKLYSLSRKYGREEFIMILQAIWNKSVSKDFIQCPHCGFNSLGSDLSCLVCGRIVNEQYVRSQLDFNNKFKLYVESASVAELRSVLEIGYVLANSSGVFSPRSKSVIPGRIYYLIHLKPSDIHFIVESINERDVKI